LLHDVLGRVSVLIDPRQGEPIQQVEKPMKEFIECLLLPSNHPLYQALIVVQAHFPYWRVVALRR
jgi:hypothetical protein